MIYPDPMLRENCAPSGYLSGLELTRLAAALLATMYHAGGRGLAAPQIGVMRRVFVMDATWKGGVSEPVVMTDPEILSFSDVQVSMQEQCLSIPDRPVEVTRPESIQIAWYDLRGLFHSQTLTGLSARIAQHEIDHLNGRLIVDVE
nr:peptide deformylase [Paracoccus amoyensis]